MHRVCAVCDIDRTADVRGRSSRGGGRRRRQLGRLRRNTAAQIRLPISLQPRPVASRSVRRNPISTQIRRSVDDHTLSCTTPIKAFLLGEIITSHRELRFSSFCSCRLREIIGPVAVFFSASILLAYMLAGNAADLKCRSFPSRICTVTYQAFDIRYANTRLGHNDDCVIVVVFCLNFLSQ